MSKAIIKDYPCSKVWLDSGYIYKWQPKFLTNNDDMEEWLLAAGKFEKVKAIGHTLVEGRNTKRYIWMCE